MTLKDRLKTEIDRLDDRALELLYKIARQLPHLSEGNRDTPGSQEVVALLQEIANTGGLGIENPSAWQRDSRNDRPLPLRES